MSILIPSSRPIGLARKVIKMAYLALGLLVFLLVGSAYSYMRFQQEAKKRSDLLYSELLLCIDGALVKETRDSNFPLLEGHFNKYKIKVIPVVDTLSLRSLPRLYFRVIIYIKNDIFCRIETASERSYLCSPACYEGTGFVPDNNFPELKIFMRPTPESKDYSKVVDILSKLDFCTEILITDNFIMATFLAAKAKKNYYQAMRAAIFPPVILKQEKFKKNVELVMELREEVAGFETGEKQIN